MLSLCTTAVDYTFNRDDDLLLYTKVCQKFYDIDNMLTYV